jgi:sorting nexin-1/2
LLQVFAKAKTAKKEGEQKKGFMSFLTEKVTSVQAAIGKPEEIDNWFEEQKTYLNTLETQLHQLLNRASVISSHSRAISTSWASLGQASNALQSCELDQDKVLATFYGKLTEVSNQVSALEKELAENETEYFEDSMKDYIRIIGATKDVLSNRSTDLWHYQQATKSREGQADKLEKGRGTSKEASLADQLREVGDIPFSDVRY